GYKADGIIPLREYSDRENENPTKEFKVGDMITADILKMNDGIGNVLLTYKRAQKRIDRKECWDKIEICQKMKGIVTAMSSYGAFVEVA
ncbi:S1 RNA-binding domain-containing protein, partial [Escherichia coli]|uniref:S1 RNA-binding domain-containing protein n=1 Tax=Escherichia coli TaxID=562 RepID=UPI00390C4CF4